MLAALALSALLSQGPTPSAELTVYVFTTTDCPISDRYAPEIQRLAGRFAGKAKFVLVYPVQTDTPKMIDARRKKFGYALTYQRDTNQTLVRLTGATVTPEVAVMRAGQVLYLGRIDDRYIDFGKDRPEPTTHDLADALDALIAGRPVAQKQTRAVGCIISDLVKQ